MRTARWVLASLPVLSATALLIALLSCSSEGPSTPGGGGTGAEAGGQAGAGNAGDAGMGGAAGGGGGSTACQDGPVTGDCQCGNTTVTGDYCCGDVAQIGPCEEYGGGGDTYTIDPAGSDDTGDGSSASPWLTLAHACSQVTSPGDVIHVDAGTYTEAAQCQLAVGVSIEGEGPQSVITSTMSSENTPIIRLSSDAEGTDGNQHISFLALDGSGLSADSPLAVVGRSRVSLHDLRVVDFYRQGPSFSGDTSGDGVPEVYATGNMFYGNEVQNCARDYYQDIDGTTYHFADGGFLFGGQEGMLIHHNTFDETERFGYPVKFAGEGHDKGCKIYANAITANFYDGQPNSWNISIELWYSEGGIEIFDNVIQGPIDFGGAYTAKGDYPFAADVHHNVIGPTALQSHGEQGLYIERAHEGPLYVRNNTFRNVESGIAIYPDVSDTVENIYIYDNVFDHLGIVGSDWYGAGIVWDNITSEVGTELSNIDIVDNVFNAGDESTPGVGIRLPNLGHATAVTVRNNIVQGFHLPVYGDKEVGSDVTIDGLSIENNLFWNNTNGNDPELVELVPTNTTIQNNLVADPAFVAADDFHLKAGSPAIDAGLPIPYVSVDHEDVPVGNPPNIGCYETVLGP